MSTGYAARKTVWTPCNVAFSKTNQCPNVELGTSPPEDTVYNMSNGVTIS